MKNTSPFHFILLLTVILVLCQQANQGKAQGKIINTEKPWTYWWWMGSAVDTATISYQLKLMKQSQLGGVHIIPIYGVKGQEENYIRYLSPQWQQMLKFTSQKAKELDLGVDMTLGTGWCFGGIHVDKKTGIKAIDIEKLKVKKGEKIQLNLNGEGVYEMDSVIHVLAVYPDKRQDITDKISRFKSLEWRAPENAVLYFIRLQGPVFKVKRAAPGGEGYMLDPFSDKAFRKYVTVFDTALTNYNNHIRSVYHDSYEYYGGNWTTDFFMEFKQRRGYDLKNFIPELMQEGDTNISHRIIADYRQTIAELHLGYVKEIAQWAKNKGLQFRNQGHGSPANWLDIYAAVTIPETETFGSTPFKIEGLSRIKKFIRKDAPNRFVCKFASSPANFYGKKYVSSETHTWLREHFRVALSHCKPELDQLFLSGINHVFFHGTAYSPKQADWPGWLFYASTNFAPSNSFYHHFPAMNKYIANCQHILQNSQIDNEILVYFPIQDIWHKKTKNPLFKPSVHNYNQWLTNTAFHKSLQLLDSLSFSFDYISDNQLLEVKTDQNKILAPGKQYKAILVPACQYMPLSSLKKLHTLARAGANIIFHKQLPRQVSGYNQLAEKQENFNNLKKKIAQTKLNNLKITTDKKMVYSLAACDVKYEEFSDFGLSFIRLKQKNNYIYFISNLYSGKDISAYVPFQEDADYYELFNPLTGKSCKGSIKPTKNKNVVKLNLKQGESIFVFPRNKKPVLPNCPCFSSPMDTVRITGTWKIKFLKGGPTLPPLVETNKLISWTHFGDSLYENFSGLARYSIQFEINKQNNKNYLLVFDEIKESARIRLNGKEVTTLFAFPFETPISPFLKNGKNLLEVEVANLAANRIRFLDRQGIEWKKFHNINFVNINYKKFDAARWKPLKSGITGNVYILSAEK